MKELGRILIVDDEERWRDELAETLDVGFYVEAVATTREVEERLKATFFHLLVLDIRMEDTDPSNVEGMRLLEEIGKVGFSQAIHIIVLSGYGTSEQMREAFRQYGVYDFQAKQDFYGPAFLAQVQKLFADEMRINLDLRCGWQDGLSAKEVVVNLQVGDLSIKRGTPLHASLAEELEDLLCRLFFRANSLLLQPLGSCASGTGVFRVQPFSVDGGALPVVVKCGGHGRIDDEYRNYERFVRPFVGGGRMASAQAPRRTLRLGGIVYSLLGGAGDHFEEFASFYRRSDTAALRQALDHLFFETCSAWYTSPGQVKPLDLTQQYSDWLALTPQSLNEAMADMLKTIQGNEMLHFRSLTANRSFRNPILALRRDQIILPTYETVTHGDLSEHNILLDEEGHSWLIDFQKTGYGHILRDVIQLDTMVRLHLLASEEATLDERLGLEEALCSAHSFSQVTQLAPASLAPCLDKAFATCIHLRTIAARLVTSHSGADIREFYAGAMYCALEVIRTYSLPPIQREHAVLSASVLSEHLSL